MKKLLSIIVLALLYSGNAFAHNEDKFVFLICEDSFNEMYEVHIDFRKKTVSSFNMKSMDSIKHEITKTTERWISAKAIDNDNKRIIIHRYVGEAKFQEFKNGKWKETSYDLECKKIKKNF
jgi:hypothetical protein